MKHLYHIFISLFLRMTASSKDIKDLSPLELIELGRDVSQLGGYNFQTEDVKFFLITHEIPQPVRITSENRNLLNISKTTKFVIHGWLESHKRSWYKNISREYLKQADMNFVEIDWEKPARIPYPASARATRSVGMEVAKFIIDTNLSPENIHLIGHSLGSHVAGFAGKTVFEKTGEKLQRISGLDPAGPFFRDPSISANDRLDKTDAVIVDVIHTDAGFYGYEKSLGTLDIYVNGGMRIQPGCLNDPIPSSLGDFLEKSLCSHTRSYKYFIEWINSGNFHCKFCEALLVYNFPSERCVRHKNLIIAEKDVGPSLTGICFAKTNSDKPYLA
ncbi:pancreatic triacylglycerol lipase-like [Cylas formicarius]|uniref:pancreatic triacylglycerol lipase-like n=1 Tax=Cylas formicarius TaxID=197179 RepID=UPI0029585164|nr:pancreatic triacylglycerol lipase-like [Cylas formicarius]